MLALRIFNCVFRPRPSRRIQPLPHLFKHINNMSTSAVAKRLSGKTILITGASSGIGRSTALEFARTSPSSLKLILTARRIDTLKEVAEQIKKETGDGVKVLTVKLDVSDPEAIKGFVGGLPEEFKDIDVLVNNAFVWPIKHQCCRLTSRQRNG